ncbi:hypothetical protein C5O80_31120 [Burkholderia sp. SRS-46]|nr:hypothetical protein C5O80_31120 [Burkholderia sp. SRS-46]
MPYSEPFDNLPYRDTLTDTNLSGRLLGIEDVLAIEGFNRTYGPLFEFSPCRTRLAVVITNGLSSAQSASPQTLLGVDRARLCLIDLATRDVRRLSGPDECGLFSPTWSPCGTMIAAAATNGERIRPCVVDVASGQVRLLGDRDLDVYFSPTPSIHWISGLEIVCRLLPRGARIDAISLTRDTPELATAAWRQQREGQHATASALSVDVQYERSDIVCIDVATGAVISFRDEDALPELIAEFANRQITDTTVTSQIEDLYSPDRSLFSDASTGQALTLRRSDDGPTTLNWRTGHENEDSALLICNDHLAGVLKGPVRDLTYRLEDGTTAVTRCILPPDWSEGQPRRAVVFVYPEYVCDVGVPAYEMLDQPGLLNLHLLAAQGYVVLQPSLPFFRDSGGEMIDSLAAGVKPALDAAAEAGLIDRTQVHVMGHSRGGWATMALLATTELFRSGIAIAGFSDLIALHGQIDMRRRYRSSYGGLALDQACEDSFALPGPPAQHADHYLRNSPLFRADSIHAPLLILHGDLDSYPPITQSEAMFHALHRLGKPVEFVRYWGEEHIFTSPANIRDAFNRIVAWLQRLSPADVA